MSRGMGRIQTCILAALAAEPDNALTVEDLCDLLYPGANRIEKKHRVSVIRALRSIAQHDEASVRLMSGSGKGRTLIAYDPFNLNSYAMARSKASSFYRRRNRYSPAGGDQRTEEAELRERLRPGGGLHHLVREGGTWFEDVAYNVAVRGGDEEEAARLSAKRDAEFGAFVAVGKALAASRPARRIRKRRSRQQRDHDLLVALLTGQRPS